MKSSLEPEDIQAIAEAVVIQLTPILALKNAPPSSGDEILDVPGLAKYLKVETSWVYKQLQLKTIPHFHAGRYPRFYKMQIDKWSKENSTPAVGVVTQLNKLRRAA